MKILIVTHFAPPHMGGIEFVVWEQTRRLRERGHEVAWFTSAVPRDPAAWRDEGRHIVRHPALNPLEAHGIPYPIFLPGMGRKLRHLVASADVVHAHGMLYQGTSAARRLARRFRKPMVLTCHVIDRARGVGPGGSVVARLRGAAIHAVERLAHCCVGRANLRGAGTIVVLNEEVRQFVEAAVGPDKPIKLIPNGVDVDRFRPADLPAKAALRARFGLPPDKLVIGFIGRLVPRKGAHLVVAGAPADSHLFIVGDGELPPGPGECEHRMTRLPAQPRARIPEILQACDLLALPSLGEGFPLIAQEAMAVGLPVLLSDEPGYGRYVDETVAVLVKPSVDGVRDGLALLAGDPARREQMGRTARERMVARFSWDANVDEHLALYDDLLAGAGRISGAERATGRLNGLAV